MRMIKKKIEFATSFTSHGAGESSHFHGRRRNVNMKMNFTHLAYKFSLGSYPTLWKAKLFYLVWVTSIASLWGLYQFYNSLTQVFHLHALLSRIPLCFLPSGSPQRSSARAMFLGKISQLLQGGDLELPLSICLVKSHWKSYVKDNLSHYPKSSLKAGI